MGHRRKNARAKEQSRRRGKEGKRSDTSDDGKSSGKPSSSSQSKLLSVHERLELPLLELNENNLLTDSDDEETLEFEIRPRFVYSCNMCLVCMDASDAPVMCENCKMVSYCSEEHRDRNRSQHDGLCRVLTEECSGIDGFRIAKDIPPDLYRSFRIKMIDLIEERIGRRLDLWEREIILYPRVCRTCRKIDDLECCTECLIDFYCEHHREDHLEWCRDSKVFGRILAMQHKHGYVSPNFPDVPRNKCSDLPENFDALLLEMFRNNVNYRRIDCYTYASMSLSATAPLTALLALQKTCDDWRTKESLDIHIVGAEFQFECSSIRVWEKLFVHYLPRLKKLSLEFTGPELYLPPAPPELLGKVQMCRRCKLEERAIRVTFNPGKLYHQLDTRAKRKPDLICLFNPGLYRETGFDRTDTWPLTIERFCDAGVPVLVTSYTEIEIPKDIQRIRSIRRIELLVEPQKNPFAAVKPDRNFVSDDIVPLVYKNYCLSVVRGLPEETN